MLKEFINGLKKARIAKIDKGFRKNTNNLLRKKINIVQWRKIQTRLNASRYALTATPAQGELFE